MILTYLTFADKFAATERDQRRILAEPWPFDWTVPAPYYSSAHRPTRTFPQGMPLPPRHPLDVPQRKRGQRHGSS